MVRVATVFSGIGAPEEALKQLGVEHDIVFACDNGERELKKTYDEIIEDTEGMSYLEQLNYVNELYDKTKKVNYVKKSYFANHPITEDRWFEDVRFINGDNYNNKVDLFIGGSPCQSFSTYGKKKGFEDTRGTLFFYYANLIEKIRPSVFIYENVVGLKTHDNGNTWQRIRDRFDSLEYDYYDFELDAQDYGLPQIRKRVFVVGFDKKYGIGKYDAPKKLKLEKIAADYLDNNVDIKYYLGKKGFEWVTTPAKHQGRSRINRDIIGCQTANQQFNWTGDFRLEEPTDELRNSEQVYVGTYSGDACDEFKGRKCVARKLTPIECIRLMGFEDFKFDPEVSEKNIYRQSGNSIAVPVLKALLKDIIKTMNW
ncbi:MAG: DNA (cytosine-5-)-methyltransferase [Eubacterium sp.]|nr:DNA (cytosine-5-)-methyltransferase [Eubacterium sp.]